MHWLLRNALINFQIFVGFPDVILLFISNLILLWSKNTFCMTSLLLNVLRLTLQPSIRGILGNLPCVLEKKVYFIDVVGYGVLHIFIKDMDSISRKPAN